MEDVKGRVRGSVDDPSRSTESRREQFERAFLEAVDKGLIVLSESVRHTIFFYLEKNYGLKREEISEKLEEFSSRLEGLFGSAALVVEKLIIKDLHQRLGLKYKDMNWSFTEHVRAAQETYSRAILRRDEILDFVKNVKATDHFTMLYDRLEDKRLVAFTYLKLGLEQGEAAIYIAGVETPEQIRQAMKKFSIDVDTYERNGGLRIVDYDQWYIIDGKVDPSEIVARWRRALDESRAKSWKGLRAIGEIDCFLKHNLVTDLVEYEKTLGRSLQIPIVAMCILNSDLVAKMTEIETYLALIKAHGSTIFA